MIKRIPLFYDIIEAFNDTSETSIDVDSGPPASSGNTLNDQPITPATVEAFGLAKIPIGGTMAPAGTIVAFVARGTVPLCSTLPGWNNDGTTGVADIYIRIETAVAV